MSFTQLFNTVIVVSISAFGFNDIISFYDNPSADFALHLLYLVPIYYSLLTVSRLNLRSTIWMRKVLVLMAVVVLIINPFIIVPILNVLAIGCVIGLFLFLGCYFGQCSHVKPVSKAHISVQLL
ncbi:hypothetical protein [Shewanella aestuarii]|uniref:Uncharacterized protein n=1 Tax=Shewanella aestuarii TaxID=1028752 RepID=A0A6G9QPW2_9GAMM|nr:hypothetical protein [Shewanella aestuarii]QIR16630.1 hypothetical protein HBH39_19330 [Shewanella aestuarii]